jgi:hypothetical protein
MKKLPTMGKFHESLPDFIKGHALLRLQRTNFKMEMLRQPLALTLPLKSMGIRHTPWQLETKLPQSQTDAKGVDGRAIGDGFPAVHESAIVKVFGCRPHGDGATRSGGRRSENPQRTKPRVGLMKRCRRSGRGLWGFEPGGARERVNLSGRRARLRTQLQRYGMDIAKWGFRLSPHL